MFNVITIGDCTIDTFLIIDQDEAKLQCDLNHDNCLLCLNYADKIPIKNTEQAIGGNAANLAVGLKKLGLETAVITELGDDINGHIIKNELEKNEVNTNLLKILPNRETRYSVILSFQSERTVLSYHAKRNYSLDTIPPTEWVYYTSLGENFEKTQDKLSIHLNKNPKLRLAMNPGSYQLKKNIKKIKAILPRVDLLFVNKEEASTILGKKKSIVDYLNYFIKLGIETVVITDGTNGSYASRKNEKYFMPIFPILPVDKTGAGDAYATGFMSALILGETLPMAMRWGTGNAGSVTTKIGAEPGLLDKAGINKILKKFPKILPKEI